MSGQNSLLIFSSAVPSGGYAGIFLSFFSKCNHTIGSIGHRVWSMSLNILTELSVNLFNEKHNSAEPSAQSVIVMQF